MKKVRINAEKPYDILIGAGLLSEAGSLLRSVCNSNRLVIVTDDVVDGFYGDILKSSLEDQHFSTLKYVISNGENHKNISQLEDLLNFLAENHVHRNETILALGGGMIGDLAGFAAAIYLRGIGLVQIPTTLLAMVDSAVGGKTGINLPGGKNLVGAFWQPRLVIADPNTLKTLPQLQFVSGMGEVIKYDAITQRERQDPADMETLISDCVITKAKLVEQDERDENGIREVLNAGHTIGHAMERLSDYTIPHGIAVASGLLLEAKMAVDLGLTQPTVYEKLLAVTERYGLHKLYQELSFSPEQLMDAMKNDKKNRDDRIAFVLPIDDGAYESRSLPSCQVMAFLQNQ